MAVSAGSVRAGGAHVVIEGDDSPFNKAVARVEAKMKSSVAVMSRIGGSLINFGAGAGVGIGALAKIALDTQGVMRRFRSVFKEQADAANEWANATAAATGQTGDNVRRSLTVFQQFFNGLGLGAGKASEMSKQITGLAADFAAFNGLSDDEAIGRLISALSGSSEVLDQFGVNIKQAALQQELLDQGINKSIESASE